MRGTALKYFPEFPGDMLSELVDTCVLDLKAYGYIVNSHTRAAITHHILKLTAQRITEVDEIRQMTFSKFAT